MYDATSYLEDKISHSVSSLFELFACHWSLAFGFFFCKSLWRDSRLERLESECQWKCRFVIPLTSLVWGSKRCSLFYWFGLWARRPEPIRETARRHDAHPFYRLVR